MRAPAMLHALSQRSALGRVRAFAVLACLASLGVFASACSEREPTATGSGHPAEAVSQRAAALAGVDGAGSITQAGTVVNRYTALAANAAANATSIQVASAAALASGSDALAAGDLLIIAQMQGATIETAATDNTWGAVTALNGAGLYELVEVLAVTGNTITLSCGLKNAYAIAGNAQVVRVPQYDSLSVASGGSITAPAWNGTVGGIVAVHVKSALSLAGTIDASALGFRGGLTDDDSANASTSVTIYASSDPADGARKGEGIAGQRPEYGRAPAANGGGGGNSHNGGGGGGANARSGAAWTGQGVFDLSVTGGVTAWLIDPNYSASGSQGGGRGGYSYSANDLNALTSQPGLAGWGGNNRRQRGGLGGHPVDNDPSTRVFLGGGGGAGDGNNGHSGRGGNGGGLVVVIAGSISGSGKILANGEAGIDANSTTSGLPSGDAPGGGGGGGTVIVRADTVSAISVEAHGGAGGKQIIDNGGEGEGPGGGGGGGFISVSATVSVDVAGGVAGTTNSPALSEFPVNGATRGGAGQSELGSAASGAVPYCVDTSAPDTIIDTGPATGSTTTDSTPSFTFHSSDASATFECSLDSGGYTACSSPLTTSALAEGSHTFRVRAKDPIGNRDASPATRTFTVDTAAPNTTIDSGPAQGSTSSDRTPTFAFSSSEAGSTFECAVDGGAFADCTTPLTTASLSDGSHTFKVRATDAAGNTDATPATRTWTVDRTAPNTVIDSGPSGTVNETTAVFEFSSPDAGATFECSIDGGTFAACTTPLSMDQVSPGEHTFAVRAKDSAGNVDATPATQSWTVAAPPGDSDGDGLTDDVEDQIGTNKNDADSDDDGVLDGAEPQPGVDSDGDGLINALDPDSDNDGLFDGTELGLGCGNTATNSARHSCVADADSGATTTDPLDADTDDGGVSDGSEDGNLNGATDEGETDPTAGHGDDDATVTDSDGDGLSDGIEGTLHSNPNDKDSDDDGVLDGDEPNPSADGDGDGLIDVLDVDSDNDGLLDGTELGNDCSNADTDGNLDHCRPDADPTTTTSPLDPDTDHGGARDGSEDSNTDGKLDPGETNPVVGEGADDGSVVDTDGDGLSDGTEGELGSDPQDADSDDDGVLDGLEPNPSDDQDGDGYINVLDSDSDDDGLFDGTEAGNDCSNGDTDTSRNQCVADDDDGATFTSVLNRDTDFGGVIDGEEDTNHNGAVDPDERDPLQATDDSGGETGSGGAGGIGGVGEAGAAGGGAGPVETGGTTSSGGESSGGTSSGGTNNTGATNSGDTGGTPAGGTTAFGGSPGASGSTDQHIVVLGGGLCAFRPITTPNALAALSLAAAAALATRRRKK